MKVGKELKTLRLWLFPGGGEFQDSTISKTEMFKYAMITLLAALLLAFGCSADPGQAGPGSQHDSSGPSAAANSQPLGPPADPHEGMVEIRAGEFIFGATEKQFESYVATTYVSFPGIREEMRPMFNVPARKVSLPAFRIDQFEVTNKQYRDFLAASGYRPKDATNYLKHWETPDKYPEWAADFPVVWISEDDAAAYCAWRKAALPTEEQWERAARFTDGRVFPWGTRPDPTTSNLGAPKIEPTGNRTGDRSPDGVFDLGGNVAEITSTRAQDPKQGTVVVIRGGFFNSGPKAALAYKRAFAAPGSVRSESIGCRCVR